MAEISYAIAGDYASVHSDINITRSAGSGFDLFRACFRLQTCETCLASRYPCSWCTTSQVCVPNTRAPFPFQILAPIKYEDICPMAWRERWEMRAKPFSCRCSSMTLISVVVAVVSTLASVFLLWLLVKWTRWGVRKWKGREPDWWSRRWSRIAGKSPHHDEQRPLLGET